MDAKQFDSLTRVFARKLSRRSFVGAAAAIGAVAPFAFTSAASASSAVLNFYGLLDAYQYSQAYAMLGSTWHSQQSLSTFTNGYANTAFVQCTTTGESAVSGGTSVAVKLISWHNDGSIVAYSGHYVVGTEGGQQRIISGNNAVVSTPVGTPGLCNLDDLSLSVGPWNAGAGQRYSNLIARNKVGHTCILGGSPRLYFKDANGRTITSSSVAGTGPTAVYLHPGRHANAPLQFGNDCPSALVSPVKVSANVAGDSRTGSVSDANGISDPPCLGSGQGVVLAVQNWRPGVTN